ncbi:MAG: hypothetical protein SVU88_05025 [Candidatus Nanohaloarchaea archaeon]|nr:hypothetical protein [Candidatus Nanohaloarchaea archaeon]
MTKPTFRVPEDAVADVDRYAEQAGIEDRSDVLRTAVEAVLPHIEEGYVDPDENALMDGYSGDTVTIGFRDSADYGSRVQEVADRAGVSKSSVWRTVLAEYLEDPDRYTAAAAGRDRGGRANDAAVLPGYMAEDGILNPATLLYLRDAVVRPHVPAAADTELGYLLDLKLEHVREHPDDRVATGSHADRLADSIERFGYDHPLPYANLANIYGDNYVEDLEEEFMTVAAYLDGKD